MSPSSVASALFLYLQGKHFKLNICRKGWLLPLAELSLLFPLSLFLAGHV